MCLGEIYLGGVVPIKKRTTLPTEKNAPNISLVWAVSRNKNVTNSRQNPMFPNVLVAKLLRGKSKSRGVFWNACRRLLRWYNGIFRHEFHNERVFSTTPSVKWKSGNYITLYMISYQLWNVKNECFNERSAIIGHAKLWPYLKYSNKCFNV